MSEYKKSAALLEFETFLSQINLTQYRNKYSKIKTVELDLPKSIQALKPIYEHYWSKRGGWRDYDEFYEQNYKAPLKDELETFREESYFSSDTFYIGLPARIYRTWGSILTQIQAGYVAESLYGQGAVTMSAELDWQGIDIQIKKGGAELNIQVKKESMSREVRQPKPIKKRNIDILQIEYEVPPGDKYKQDGEERKPFKDWRDKWGEKLSILDNGFVIFTHKIFYDQSNKFLQI